MSIPFYVEGRQAGQIVLEKEGLFYILEAKCPEFSRNLYRAFAFTSDARLDLGIMIPENGDFHAKKRFSASQLTGLDPHSIIGGEAVLETVLSREDYWTRTDRPGSLFAERELAECAKEIQYAYCCESEGVTQCAVPFSAAKRFPLVPIFCLARFDIVMGQECILYKIDKNGKPKL